MVSIKKKPSIYNRLNQQMQKYPSEGRFALLRNLSLGGSAACLAVLIQILQIGVNDNALTISVLATAVGMPLWLGLSAIYEFYIFLGPSSYPHFQGPFGVNFVASIIAISGIASLIAVGGVLWHLLPESAFVFVGGVVIVFLLVCVFYWHLARWWFGDKGPGSVDSEAEN